jgi:hypothetical protein
MTDDIVKRLRYGLIDTNTSYRYMLEAADEIEKLRAALAAQKALTNACERVNRRNDELLDEVRKLRAALKPFAEQADRSPWTITPMMMFAAKAALGESDD